MLHPAGLVGPRSAALVAADRKYVKGSPARETLLPLAFARGQGHELWDADGLRYVDLAAGLTTPCGHCHPDVATAVADGARRLAACEDYTNEFRGRLTGLLEEWIPSLGGVHYFSSGTEAVEGGMRMLRTLTGGKVFLSFARAYHGKTAGSARLMSEADPRNVLPFSAVGSDHDEVASTLTALTRRVRALGGHLAGLVVEPVQGNAGVMLPHPDLLAGVQEVCDSHKVPVLADEVLTGCGRTGTFLASEATALRPTVVALGKGIGNGMPVSVAVVTTKASRQVSSLEGGTSFGGNPVSMAAAEATLGVLRKERLMERARDNGLSINSELAGLVAWRGIADVRVCGSLAAIEFASTADRSAEEAARLAYVSAASAGVLVTPSGRTLRLSPALSIPTDALVRALRLVREASLAV